MNFKRDGSNLDSPVWIKNKKKTINLLNEKGNEWFQYTIKVALNHKDTETQPKRIITINFL